MTKVRGSVGVVGVGVGVGVRVGETSEGIDMRETRGEGETRRSAVLCPNLVLSSLVRDGDRGGCRGGRQSDKRTGPGDRGTNGMWGGQCWGCWGGRSRRVTLMGWRRGRVRLVVEVVIDER